ncbi:MAG: hypothetical protein JNL80_07645, partial [Phycisphaerae bacterium]|nr:hypothetical protein [Phycisphaerae bacterium]
MFKVRLTGATGLSLRRIACSLPCAVLLTASPALGETKVWDGGAGTNSWHDATNWSPDGVPTTADDVVIDAPGPLTVTVNNSATALTLTCSNGISILSGSLSLADASTCHDFQQSGGSLAGAGTLAVTGSFAWSKGSMDGPGATVVMPGASVSLAGTTSPRFLGRELELRADGTTTMDSSSNPIYFSGGTLRIASGATLTASGGNWFKNNGGTNAIIIEGTLTKIGAGDTELSAGTLTLSGAVDVQAGVVLLASGAQTGSLAIASGATCRNISGSYVLNAGSSLSGTGSLSVNGGAITVASGVAFPGTFDVLSGTLTVNAASSA